MDNFNSRMLFLNSYWEALKDKFDSIFTLSSTNILYIVLKCLGDILFFIPFFFFTLISIVLNLGVYIVAFLLTVISRIFAGIAFRNISFGKYFSYSLIISRFLLCFIFDALQTLFYILCTLPDKMFKTNNFVIIDGFKLYTFFLSFILYFDTYTLCKYNKNYIGMRKLLLKKAVEEIIQEKEKEFINNQNPR